MSDLFRAVPQQQAAPSATVRVWMAGDYDAARVFTRRWCSERGACWALSPVDYIYTGGEERGLVATLIHYPRFPRSEPETTLMAEAREFGEALMVDLGQQSFSIEGPRETVWITRRIGSNA